MNDLTTNKTSVIISDKERKLLELLHEIKYGHVFIYLEKGQPERVIEVRKNIKL